MVIYCLLMDVLNVCFNVNNNVLIVFKAFVKVVSIQDGYLINNIFVQPNVEMELLLMAMNNVMMAMIHHMMAAFNVNFNVNYCVHYAKTEFALNVIILDGLTKIFNAILFVVMV